MNPGNRLSWGESNAPPRESAETTKPGLVSQERQAMNLPEIHRRLWNQPPQLPARGGWF
jgi:hypothetical protein